jgi:hypothetical protein
VEYFTGLTAVTSSPDGDSVYAVGTSVMPGVGGAFLVHCLFRVRVYIPCPVPFNPLTPIHPNDENTNQNAGITVLNRDKASGELSLAQQFKIEQVNKGRRDVD